MGIAIPQVITSDRASGNQVIDGSLKFDGTARTHLTRTVPNITTFTLSFWYKTNLVNRDEFFDTASSTGFYFYRDGQIKINNNSSNIFTSNGYYRDSNSFYHVVLNSDGSDVNLYVNGVLDKSTSVSTQLYSGTASISSSHATDTADYYLSQYYLIDGQALTPDSFGFTDGLTNTWKPKKYTGTFGTNGFYLPFDGNSPIGQDKSGNGNNYTPKNFGGSVALDKATGAKPILNTTPGGTQAGVGVFGSKQNVGYAVTVYDDGGGNKYYIDGVKQATLTGLIRGATYTFDTSDSTVSSHPFRFSESDGGSQYTNGVAAITGAATTITIPYNSSNELYYYCTSHSGMGSSITGITTNEKLADQYASNCTLALPLVGNDDDVCASIACTANNKTPTNSSVTAATTQSNFYSGSHYWNANSDTLQYAEQGDELVFGSGDYTIECWLYDDNGHNGTNNRCYIFDNRIGGSVVGDPPTMTGYIDSHNEFNFGDGTNTITHTVSSTVGKWWHYAVSREGTTTRMFIDGILRGSDTSSTNFTNNGIGVGRATDANYGFAGYIQDFRVYKGIAKYTSNFVPASTNPDILPDTPSGVSGSSKLPKITDGSFASPDSRDALQVQDSDDLAFGTGEFTVEMFFYANTVSGNDVLYDSRAATGSPADGFSIVRNSDQLRTYTSGDYAITPSTFRVASNRWYHLAITRESTTQKMYIDGVLVGSATVSNDFSQPKATVGSDVNGSEEWDGFISSFRLIKGTALYTANFIPPSRALTNVTNTKLLCCQSNTSQTESTVIPDVTQFPAPYSAANKFSSIKYYTTVKQNQTSATTLPMSNPSHYQGNALDLASGGFQITTVNSAAEDFFMGMWVHFDTYATSKQFGVDIANNYVYFETQSSGAVKIRHTGDGGSTSSSTSLNDGNWHHIALSRTGDTLYGFVDGTAVVNDSGGLSGNNSVAANSKFNFWGADNNFTSYNIDGQIIDAFIYIGKGVSSYTTPTAPLVGSDGTINHYSGFTDSDAYFISPCVDVTGSSANSLSGFFKEVAGADTGSATTFNPFITDINTVRGQETGYATLNPLDPRGLSNSPTFSEGNLRINDSSSYDVVSTIGADSGRWYWEVEMIDVGTTICGIIDFDNNRSSQFSMSSPTVYYATTRNNGTREGNQSGGTNFTYTDGDIVAWALDVDNLKLYGYKNGVLMSTATITQSDVKWAPYVYGESTTDHRFNFGQKPFKFPPPDGFQPLNAANTRLVKVFSRPDQFVGVTTYTGSGASVSPRTIELPHAADLVWVKSRDRASSHQIADTVRGNNSVIRSNTNHGAQNPTTQFNGGGVSIIDGKTISLVKGSTNQANNENLNDTDEKGVVWSWKAGGSKNTFNVDNVGYSTYTTAPGLDEGTIKINAASVGTKQGFSIIKYTGNSTANATLPHGLSEAPKFVIIKNLSNTYGWAVLHTDAGTTGTTLDGSPEYYMLQLDSNADRDDFSQDTIWNPTSTTVKIDQSGGANWVNNSNSSYIAYLWHDVPGLQKFGTYEGNGNVNGPYVELGFTPAILILKNIDSDEHWYIYDPKRSPHNVAYQSLLASSSDSENSGASDTRVDLLSNGFKLRQANGPNNSNTYVYMAWAAAPSIDLYGGGANAR